MVTVIRRLPLFLPLVLATSALVYREQALPLAASALLLGVFVADVGLVRRARARIANQTNDERRALLLKGVAGVAGIAGAAGLARAIPQPATASKAETGIGFTRRLRISGLGFREIDGHGHGELYNGAGDKVGDFYSTTTQLQAPFGDAVSTGIHQHVFVLPQGMLFGMGAEGRAQDEATYSVIGGTGIYAGASGMYTAINNSRDSGGDGSASFKFKLKR